MRLTNSEPGYDDGAVVPCGDWQSLTEHDIEQLRPTSTTPGSVLIEFVRRRLPAFDTDDVGRRFDAAALLDCERVLGFDASTDGYRLFVPWLDLRLVAA